jgi:2-oxoglutarate ferredoxin oxidoreductase subunit delta
MIILNIRADATHSQPTLRENLSGLPTQQGDPMPAKGWIEVSDTYCKGCELCISACPQEVMELDMSRLTPKGYHPAHTFKDGCTGCAICALVCPDAAITVYREITKVAAPAAA